MSKLSLLRTFGDVNLVILYFCRWVLQVIILIVVTWPHRIWRCNKWFMWIDFNEIRHNGKFMTKSPLINCPFLTCHSDGEVSSGFFVPPEDTNVNSRVLVCHICDFYDRTTDLNAGRGQNPEAILVPIEGHAGSGVDVTTQLENISRLQQKMFWGVFVQLFQNICWNMAALWAFWPFQLWLIYITTSKPVIPLSPLLQTLSTVTFSYCQKPTPTNTQWNYHGDQKA